MHNLFWNQQGFWLHKICRIFLSITGTAVHYCKDFLKTREVKERYPDFFVVEQHLIVQKITKCPNHTEVPLPDVK